MNITPIGWIFLLAGPVMAIARPKWLYIATLFFLPFTATGVANVGSGEESSAIQISMYLGAFVVVRYAVYCLRSASVPLPRPERKALMWLGAFVVATALSLVMPVILSGSVRIPAERLLDPSTTPLQLSSHNITGVLYILYGFLFAYCVAIFGRWPANLLLSVKSFMAGSVFAALWAVLEFFCKLSGIGYPAAIFNTGTAASTMGYAQVLGSGVFRLSSVAVEPSILAQTLLVALCLYVPFVWGGRPLFGRMIDRVWFLLLFVILALTTSSTAYIGLLVAFAVSASVLVRGAARIKVLLGAAVVCGAAVLLYLFVPVVQSVFNTVFLDKSESWSALERLMTIHNSWEMFLRYPILGVGWESIASHDLVVHILANAGILGFICFAGAMFVILRQLHRSVRSARLNSGWSVRMDFAIYLAITVTLVTSAISGFLNVFGFFWFVCGLAIAGGATAAGRTRPHAARPAESGEVS